jgi:hypothetical protein
VFEVKIKSDETLPARSLLLAIARESGGLLFGRPVVPPRFWEYAPAVTAVRSLWLLFVPGVRALFVEVR